MAPHRFSATACHHLAATCARRVRFRPQCLAIDRSWASARASSRQWGEGSGPWPGSAPDRSPARHHPPGLPSVDRRPVRPRLCRRPPADRYPGSQPNHPEPGSCSRRLLRRSTARRCNRWARGCRAGAGAAPRSAAAAHGGAVGVKVQTVVIGRGRNAQQLQLRRGNGQIAQQYRCIHPRQSRLKLFSRPEKERFPPSNPVIGAQRQ